MLCQPEVVVTLLLCDLGAKPLGPREVLRFRFQLDLGDDQAGVGTDELVDLPAVAVVQDDMTPFLERRTFTEPVEHLLRIDRVDRHLVLIARAPGCHGLDRQPALVDYPELAFDLKSHGRLRAAAAAPAIPRAPCA